MRKSWIGAITLAVGIAAATSAAFAQTTGARNPPLVIESTAGNDVFAFYCASCHGRNGSGDGPVSRSLKVSPPDLRLLARLNGGEFPRSRVAAFVMDGNSVSAPAHGTTEMPVWGPVFTGLGDSNALAKVRIANLVAYLESIQRK
jgi:mono/diheme cytochrome c family protein